MTEIILHPQAHRAFLSALAKQSKEPIFCRRQEDRLWVDKATAPMLAKALAVGVFPLYELSLFNQMAQKRLKDMPAKDRAAVIRISWELAQVYPDRDLPFTGPSRYEYLTRLLTEALTENPHQNSLHMEGFLRFRLKGHQAWLNHILTLGADQLLSQQEDEDCLRLMQEKALPKPKETLRLHLFFSPGGIFHLWQQTDKGVRDLEGGCWAGMEGTLLADLIYRRPKAVILHSPELASPRLVRRLEKIFGSRLEQLRRGEGISDANSMLDKNQPG